MAQEKGTRILPHWSSLSALHRRSNEPTTWEAWSLSVRWSGRTGIVIIVFVLPVFTYNQLSFQYLCEEYYWCSFQIGLFILIILFSWLILQYLDNFSIYLIYHMSLLITFFNFPILTIQSFLKFKCVHEQLLLVVLFYYYFDQFCQQLYLSVLPKVFIFISDKCNGQIDFLSIMACWRKCKRGKHTIIYLPTIFPFLILLTFLNN